ncbi:MAG: tetratricopeptide repeat protein [Rectinemataceae bacterium]
MDTVLHGAPKEGVRKEAPKSLSHRVSAFLRKARVAILAFAGVLVAAIAVLAIVTTANDSGARKAALAMDKLSTDSNAWGSETDATKKAELEKSMLSSADSIIATYPKSLQAQQALGVKATIAGDKKEWEQAEKAWIQASSIMPKAFFAPVALQNAAMVAEERGANDKAKEYYKTFLDRYSTTAAGAAHAWFAMGRLAEEAKDFAGAVGNYEKIFAQWPQSDWAKLARDRVIFIKASGLAK